MQKKVILKGMDELDLQKYCVDLNLPKFHGTQLFRWLYKNNYHDIDKMSNIPKILKKEILILFYKNIGQILGKKRKQFT